MYFIGEITLTLSFFIYAIWFVPQLIRNAKKRNIAGLSFLMHIFLFVAYLADLLYGFGRHMEWQYRTVTCIGILSLTIQHFQFYAYGQLNKRLFRSVSIALLTLGIFVLTILLFFPQSKVVYDGAGMVANVGWWLFAIPQIIKNYRLKSVEAVSFSFVFLSLLMTSLDTISAWALHWDYPSKIGLPFSLIKKLLLLWQFYIYSSPHAKASNKPEEAFAHG